MKLNPEKEAVEAVAKIMLISARTAPKAKGDDEIVTGVVTPQEKEEIAQEMEKLGEKETHKFFKRDAQNVRDAEGLILIGLNFKKPAGVNCGACGYDCNSILKQKTYEVEYSGPVCTIRAIDLGIAIGSLVSVAKELGVDNRVMYSVGVAAKKLGIMDAQIILGIPLSIKGKNIFFDRKPL
ncbi:ferredoxin domain-containing protein [Thermodesulfovibrio sp. TK110]